MYLPEQIIQQCIIVYNVKFDTQLNILLNENKILLISYVVVWILVEPKDGRLQGQL